MRRGGAGGGLNLADREAAAAAAAPVAPQGGRIRARVPGVGADSRGPKGASLVEQNRHGMVWPSSPCDCDMGTEVCRNDDIYRKENISLLSPCQRNNNGHVLRRVLQWP